MPDIQIKIISDLKAVSTVGLVDFTVAEVLGYNIPGDMGGGIFYYDLSESVTPSIEGLIIVPTSGVGRWIRIINNTLYQISWFGIISGIDQTAKLQQILDLNNVNEIVIGLNGNITINGTGANRLNIPASKKLIFHNNCKFIGTGEVYGGIIDCSYVGQCFDDTLTIRELQNDVVSVAWWGAKRDYVTDNTAKFGAAINSCLNAPEIIIPSSKLLGNSYYYFESTLVIDRSVRIKGVGSIHSFDFDFQSTTLIWKLNTLSIDCKSPCRIVIENIKILQQLPGVGQTFDISAHGIKSNTFLYLKNVVLQEISGDGIHIDAQTGSGNADQSRLEQIYAVSCNNGIYITGTDANIINLTDIDMSSNRHWGVYDNSFLGCTYINPHFADNGKAFDVLVNYNSKTYAAINKIGIDNIGYQPDISPLFWREMVFYFSGYPNWDISKYYFSGGSYAILDINAKGLLINPYLESYQPPPILNTRSMRINGLDEHGIATGGVILAANDGRALFGNGVDVKSDLFADQKVEGKIFNTEQGYFIKDNVALYGTGIEAYSGFLGLWSQGDRRAYFENGAVKYFNLDQTPPLADNSNRVPTTAWTKKVMPILGDAIPVSGTWLLGQVIINNDPSSIIGWKCIDGGSPGTWVTIGVTTNNDIEITDSDKGLILKSPDGTRYRLSINNGGTINVSTV